MSRCKIIIVTEDIVKIYETDSVYLEESRSVNPVYLFNDNSPWARETSSIQLTINALIGQPTLQILGETACQLL